MYVTYCCLKLILTYVPHYDFKCNPGMILNRLQHGLLLAAVDDDISSNQTKYYKRNHDKYFITLLNYVRSEDILGTSMQHVL